MIFPRGLHHRELTFHDVVDVSVLQVWFAPSVHKKVAPRKGQDPEDLLVLGTHLQGNALHLGKMPDDVPPVLSLLLSKVLGHQLQHRVWEDEGHGRRGTCFTLSPAIFAETRHSRLRSRAILHFSQNKRLTSRLAEEILWQEQGGRRLHSVIGHGHVGFAPQVHLPSENQEEAVCRLPLTKDVAAWHVGLGGRVLHNGLIQFWRDLVEEWQESELRHQIVVLLSRNRAILPHPQQLPEG
mmetsp:Transcript_56025/g.88844  ORF Transcript_56025/g.88844 Transcript_56025/m.88844 type:complete len:239 (+) Transcript_56025:392-1108(+)